MEFLINKYEGGGQTEIFALRRSHFENSGKKRGRVNMDI
jgi:hypothetical protein